MRNPPLTVTVASILIAREPMCSRSQPPEKNVESVTAPSSASAAAASGSTGPAASSSPTDEIPWQWDPARQTSREGDISIATDGDRLELSPARDGRPTIVRRVSSSGSAVWERTLASAGETAVTMLQDGPTVFVALVPAHASGARLAAIDAGTGVVKWGVGLQGIGPVGHGKYSNRVQLAVHGDEIIVFGEESAGRYVEGRAIADGRLGYHRKERR